MCGHGACDPKTLVWTCLRSRDQAGSVPERDASSSGLEDRLARVTVRIRTKHMYLARVLVVGGPA